MEPKFVITSEIVTRELEVSGTVNVETREPVNFMQTLGTRIPLDTGFLPPGLRSYSQAGDHSQMVIELPPSINMLTWSEYEGGLYKTYRVAQPYRVIVASFQKGNLMGARMFYSPHPIASLDQPLYHQNVPNINCQGYGETSVGWVCLYHNEDWSTLSIAERAAGIIERCSGAETYNDQNMRETDGTRFYAQKGKPEFLTDPEAWENKTEAEGLDWVLDPELWLPVTVAGLDEQGKHVDGGVPLTVRAAMDGISMMYYDDPIQPKPDASLRREDQTPNRESFFRKVIQDAFNTASQTDADVERAKKLKELANALKAKLAKTPTKAKVTVQAPPALLPTKMCEMCEEQYYQQDMTNVPGYGWICPNDINKFIGCPGCLNTLLKDDAIILDSTFWCPNCALSLKKKKKAQTTEAKLPAGLEVDMTGNWGAVVAAADNKFSCTCCGKNNSVDDRYLVPVPNGTTYELCPQCTDTKFMCNVCYQLNDNYKAVTTSELIVTCVNCAAVCDTCGKVILKSNLKNGTQCSTCVLGDLT